MIRDPWQAVESSLLRWFQDARVQIASLTRESLGQSPLVDWKASLSHPRGWGDQTRNLMRAVQAGGYGHSMNSTKLTCVTRPSANGVVKK